MISATSRIDGRFSAVVLVTFLLNLPCCWSQDNSRNVKQDKRVIELDRKVVIDDSDSVRGKPTIVEVQLGQFLPGRILQCTIDFENNTKRSLDFSRVESGCTCLSVSPSTGKLPPGGKISFAAVIRTPSSPSKVEHSAAFAAFRGKAFVFAIRSKYSAAGVVGFKDTAVQVRVPTGSGKYDLELPIFADPLSSQELVDLEVSESLAGAIIELDYPNRRLKVSIPESAVAVGRMTGEVTIRNIETGSKDSVLLDAAIHNALSVFPSKLRFHSRDSSEGQNFVCRLSILDRNRLPGAKPANRSGVPNQPKAANRATAASFFVGEARLNAKLVRHSGAVSFYELSATEDQLNGAEGDTGVRCVMTGKKTRDSVTLPFTMHKKTRPPAQESAQ